jgi:hypothetical protein
MAALMARHFMVFKRSNRERTCDCRSRQNTGEHHNEQHSNHFGHSFHWIRECRFGRMFFVMLEESPLRHGRLSSLTDDYDKQLSRNI